ncbi:MAG: hepatitis A virus cellular receptor 1 [Prevotella sp.]|nr:hepatitis A virus cellular receptor 1 [Prevotella sp.]
MRRLTTLLTMALMTVLTLSFTSCTEDPYIADSLAGTWEGNMYISTNYDGYTYDASYTELYFANDPYSYSSGAGYWVDHYASGAPFSYIANHITWTVRNSVIYIHFVEDNYDIAIGDYYLDNGYFSGVIYDGSNQISFRLMHTSSPDWGSYDYGYYNGYYAKKNSNFTRGATDSTQVKAPVRIFRTR